MEALNRRDLDAVLERYDPEVEIVTLLLGNHRGEDAVRRLIEENQKIMPGYGYEIEELIEAGDTVIAVLQTTGAGRISQIGLSNAIAISATFRDGLVIKQQTFKNKDDALRAAGLSE